MFYALMNPYWASRESCGVFEDFEGKLWFFWQQVSNWDLVVELTSQGRNQYIGQVKHVVDTIGRRFDRDPDMIERGHHQVFMQEYKEKVQNPEVADGWV